MKQKKVTINGKTYPVVFNMKAMIGSESIAGSSFFTFDFSQMKPRIAIVIAAIFAADENADISADSIINADKFSTAKDIMNAYATVMELVSEYMDIPQVVAEAEQAEAQQGDEDKTGEDPKNV
jgi:hypothetical protein